MFSFSIAAQEESRVPSVAEQQDPTPGAETPRRELQVVNSGRVTAQSVVDGTNGDVILDGSDATYPNAGVLLRATTSFPHVAARIGGTSSSSYFAVFNSANTALLRVDGTGAVGIGTGSPAADVHLFRGDAFTTMRIEHTAAGSSSASRGARVQLYENGTAKASLSAIGSGATSAAGGANALQIWNHANGATVFATNNTERMRINADGRIGVGLSNQPSYLLHSYSTTDALSPIGAQLQTLVEANADQTDIAAQFNTFENVAAGFTNSGEATGVRTGAFQNGPGTLNNTWGLYVRTGVYTDKTGTVNTATGMRLAVISGAGTVNTGVALQIPDVQATNQYAISQEGANDINSFAGQVRIGGSTTRTEKLVVTGATHMIGDVQVIGTLSGTNVKAHYQDLAEWVPSSDDLAPGTVVVLHPQRPNEVMSSVKAYDTTVAGVVSAEPGIILGVGGAGKEQIATTGRVKVRVDARKAPVRIGDLLVTSDVAGTAMRSEAIEINGLALHRPGTIVGKALEPLDGGVGEILVLLSLQ